MQTDPWHATDFQIFHRPGKIIDPTYYCKTILYTKLSDENENKDGICR